MKIADILVLSHRFQHQLLALSFLEEEALVTRRALEQQVYLIKGELGLFLAEPEVESWWQRFEHDQGIAVAATVLFRLATANIHWACFMMLYDRIGKADPNYALAALELLPKRFPSEPGDPSLN